MARTAQRPTRRKVKVGVSLDPLLHAWAMARVGPGKEFSTLTHAIERGLALLQARDVELRAALDGEGASDGEKRVRVKR